jgi:thiol-disulfide isomerase/thioredoxin
VFYKRPDSLRQVYRARYSDVVKNPEYVEEFEKIAEAREKLKPGSMASSFNYPDINGEMVSLESFRGKVVYVDVWATWCGPCIAEFPYLKELQNELKNKEIAFVSISIDSEKDKEAWEKMVEEKEPGGYHLYAEGEWESKIAKDYVIRGIPYFIIIDKEGKLVEVFATRPSDPETKEKLINLAGS